MDGEKRVRSSMPLFNSHSTSIEWDRWRNWLVEVTFCTVSEAMSKFGSWGISNSSGSFNEARRGISSLWRSRRVIEIGIERLVFDVSWLASEEVRGWIVAWGERKKFVDLSKRRKENTRMKRGSVSIVLLRIRADGRRVWTSFIGSTSLLVNEPTGRDSIEKRTDEVFICHWCTRLGWTGIAWVRREVISFACWSIVLVNRCW